MTSRLRALSFFVAVALSGSAISADAILDTECEGYLQFVTEQADESHETHQLLAAISHPYYLIPGAWFLSLQALLKYPNPMTVITHGKEEIAVTALNYSSLSGRKKCAMTRSLKHEFEDQLGVFGGNFLLYHYTSRHSMLILDLIVTNLELEAEQTE